MKNRNLSILVFAAASLVLLGGIAPSDAAEFYKGKTLTIYVGGTAGGGMDLGARALAPFLKKHLPGNPDVVINNMGAAGGTQARNYVYEKAKKDGSGLFWGDWGPLAQITGEVGFRANFIEMPFVGGMSDSYLNVISTEIYPEIKRPADVNKAQVKAGGLRASSAADLLARLSLDVLGVKHTYIEGYEGGAKILAAIMQKEVGYMSVSNGMYAGSIIPKLVEEKKMMVLWYHPKRAAKGGFVLKPALSKIAPTFPEVYKQVHGKDPSGPKWEALMWVNDVGTNILRGLWAPPKINEEALSILRKGFVAAINDKQYMDFAIKQFVTPEFVSVEEGSRSVELLKSADAKFAAFIKEYIEAGSK